MQTNEEQLVVLGIQAAVSHPTWSGSYAVDDYGRPMLLPGMSGVVTIMSGRREQFEPVLVERANVRDYLDLPE